MSVKADKLLERLRTRAERGDLDAQCRLADLSLGLDTQEGDRAALPWLRKAARQGEPWAQYQPGLAYQEGLGVPKNKRQAMHYYGLSAAQGYDSAQLNLGILYARRQAINWFRKAAAQGYQEAIQRLSEMDAQ
jgi:TPR repeat protein